MLLIVEKCIKGGIYVTLFINMKKLIENTWDIMIIIENENTSNIGMEIDKTCFSI